MSLYESDFVVHLGIHVEDGNQAMSYASVWYVDGGHDMIHGWRSWPQSSTDPPDDWEVMELSPTGRYPRELAYCAEEYPMLIIHMLDEKRYGTFFVCEAQGSVVRGQDYGHPDSGPSFHFVQAGPDFRDCAYACRVHPNGSIDLQRIYVTQHEHPRAPGGLEYRIRRDEFHFMNIGKFRTMRKWNWERCEALFPNVSFFKVVLAFAEKAIEDLEKVGAGEVDNQSDEEESQRSEHATFSLLPKSRYLKCSACSFTAGRLERVPYRRVTQDGETLLWTCGVCDATGTVSRTG